MAFLTKLKIIGSVALSALLWVGCSGGVATYQNVNDMTKNTTSSLNSTDLLLTANAMIESMLNDPNFVQLKGKRLIEVSDIINDTTQPNLDMNLLSTKITQQLRLRSQGKFNVTRASGGSGIAADSRIIEQRQKERESEEYNQDTTMEKGTLKAADLSLSGKVSSNAASIDKARQRLDYNFTLSLTDRKTGVEVWSDVKPIVKNASNKHVAF
ncbi:penicillin-binding protein activator LpoB [Helicobacter cetorum]|uniref:Penicillin-binding protein activator LpoB n=1 Tax=Helicobacter cetorum (strain ATCC BAA-540 / CCUG 52418 / MIT 99-5656) TaxID=1163745 RepID=I0EQI9_HELCM|nr:penicillin-binding protein activator LpoB [Helicobacter cetorum]AFI05208.1 collagen-binding surface adhesin SpaP [Helicobacter cetorum MIT 99-5656]